MKSKNRRSSATRSAVGSAEDSRTVARDCSYPSGDDDPGTGTKRKKNAVDVTGSTRSAKMTGVLSTISTTNTTSLSNGSEMKIAKKKRTSNSNGSTSGKTFSVTGTNHHHSHHHHHPHQSQSNSSASSVVSAPGDPIDPYEFAVKTEDDLAECCGIIGASVPPMKRMKLDRIEDRCLPDSARSSPLPQSTFSHPSPGANSSPLAIHSHNSNHNSHHNNHVHHCTGPLSVLTDFNPTINTSSSSSACSVHRRDNTLDLDVSRVTSGTSQSHPANAESSCTPPIRRDVTTPSDLPIIGSHNPGSKYPMNRTETPLTTPAIDMNNGLTRSCRSPAQRITPTTPAPNSTTTSPSDEKHFSVATLPILTPSRKALETRCVGVNTVLEDLCKGTITEPDLLGPCEPGTTICLNGIVWLETTTGVLVVNVTWRGRTYIGTLLDSTQHDFAPPCPRDYVSPFKSSVRSSNRTKRRAGATGSNFKHNNNSNGHSNTTPATSTNCTTTTANHPTLTSETKSSTSHRQRLRGRNTSPTSTSARTPENCSTSNSTRPPAIQPTPTFTQTNNSATASPGHRPERDELEEPGRGGGSLPLISGSDEDPVTTGENATATPNDDTALLSRLTEPDGYTTSKRSKAPVRSSSSSSGSSSSENLTETNKTLANSNLAVDHCSPPPPRLSGVEDDPIRVPDSADVVDGDKDVAEEEEELEEEVDEDINSSFPITCPLAGCKKRFTHVIALRFHLNHTSHNVSKRCSVTEPGQKTSDRSHSTNATTLTTSTNTESSSLSTVTPAPPTALLLPPSSMTVSSRPPPPLHPPPPILGASLSIRPPRAVVPPIPVQHVPQDDGFYNPPTETRHLNVVSSKSDPPTHPFMFGCNDTTYRSVIGRPVVGIVGHEPSGPSTRTVTAHTVSIPHGPLIDKVDLTQSNRQVGGNNTPNQHHSQQQHNQPHHQHQQQHVTTHSKRNTGSRTSESTKVSRTNSSGASCRAPNPNLGSSTNQKSGELEQQHPSGRRGPKDLPDFTSHMPNSTHTAVLDNGLPASAIQPPTIVPTISGSMSQFANNMALLTSRVDPSTNPLFSLSPDMWPFANPGAVSAEPRAINAFLNETEIHQAARYSSGPGMWMNGTSFPTASNPTTSPPSYNPNQHNHNHMTTSRPASNAPATTSIATGGGVATTLAPTLDTTGSYGLPDFLMAAAAMSALGSNPMNNPAVMEMLRSYMMMNQSVGLGKSPVPGGTPFGQSTGLPPQAPADGKPSTALHHFSVPQPSTCCAPTMPVVQPQLPAASLASMMMAAASGPNSTLLPASMMPTFGLSPSQLQAHHHHQQQQHQQTLLSNTSAALDRLDPFKFSAAYLMQQSSSGSQLSSGFPQHSS